MSAASHRVMVGAVECIADITLDHPADALFVNAPKVSAEQVLCSSLQEATAGSKVVVRSVKSEITRRHRPAAR
jgi:hypothetical protein